eukprot:107350-Chlamydomonas_euryale.AAC.5
MPALKAPQRPHAHGERRDINCKPLSSEVQGPRHGVVAGVVRTRPHVSTESTELHGDRQVPAITDERPPVSHATPRLSTAYGRTGLDTGIAAWRGRGGSRAMHNDLERAGSHGAHVVDGG